MNDGNTAVAHFIEQGIRAQIERDYAALEYLPWQSLDELRQMLFRSSGAVEVIDQEEDVHALSHGRRHQDV